MKEGVFDIEVGSRVAVQPIIYIYDGTFSPFPVKMDKSIAVIINNGLIGLSDKASRALLYQYSRHTIGWDIKLSEHMVAPRKAVSEIPGSISMDVAAQTLEKSHNHATLVLLLQEEKIHRRRNVLK